MYFLKYQGLCAIDLHVSYLVLSPFLLNSTIRKHMGNYDIDEEFVLKVLDYFKVDDFSGGRYTI